MEKAFEKPKSGFLPGLLHRAPTTSSKGSMARVNRLPILKSLPDPLRNHFIAMAGEFVGTFLFLFFAFSGTQVANSPTQGTSASSKGDIPQGPNPAQLLYISLAFGFSLAVNAWVFFRISGGLFNPAVRSQVMLLLASLVLTETPR